MAASFSDALHCLFWSLEIERRSLVAARLKPAKTTPDTEAVESRDQVLHKPLTVFEMNLTRAGVVETCAITLVAASMSPMHRVKLVSLLLESMRLGTR